VPILPESVTSLPLYVHGSGANAAHIEDALFHPAIASHYRPQGIESKNLAPHLCSLYACNSLGHDADLLEEREIVFQMPVVGDPAVVDTHDVGGCEIDRLAGARASHESAGEMAGEAHM
jgi:hypothetical protein